MSRSNKYVCIHGHFYQPPRENAWLEYVEMQDSAAPFHDWNDRINFECYAPNAAARILSSDRFITKISNNYSKISFNFGPTLLSWMEQADPETHQAIIEGDQLSREEFGGHGSALAQVHGHLIMPLANRRDKITQVRWGVADFASRFGRQPEGIWLAETAVDTETLEILVDHGIKFTILAPRQAKAFRKLGDPDWTQLPYENIDPRRPYLYLLPSGRNITLFFYHGEISQAVAFKGLLNNGKYFAQQFLNVFDDNDSPQIAHIATDGESYGHHHRHGEMALADAINHIRENDLATVTNYGQYLELFPPDHEVHIHENSSWSCIHGVERWRANCGCNTGGNPGWTQEWRGPLRETLNWLRDTLIPLYEEEGNALLNDVWEARNDYISVILDRSDESINTFFEKNQKYPLDNSARIKALRLLEMQRQTMQMFTSCGWFFDEVSGIETNQILQYANRAIYYARQTGHMELHEEFLERLETVPSNLHRSATDSYLKHVIPSQVDLTRVATHYAVASLFEMNPESLELFNYRSESEIFERFRAGNQILSLGRTTIKSKITLSEKHFSFAVLYLGQQHIIGNISIDMDWNEFMKMSDQITSAFSHSDLGKVIGVMQTFFSSQKFTIWNLFQEEKRKIIERITAESLQQVESSFRDIYNDNYQLMSSMQVSELPIPETYLAAVKFILNTDLQAFFSHEVLSVRELNRLIDEMDKWGIDIDDEGSLNLAANERIYQEIKSLNLDDSDLPKLSLLNEILESLRKLNIHPEIWKSQNYYFYILKELNQEERSYPSFEWKSKFMELGRLLSVYVDV